MKIKWGFDESEGEVTGKELRAKVGKCSGFFKVSFFGTSKMDGSGFQNRQIT